MTNNNELRQQLDDATTEIVTLKNKIDNLKQLVEIQANDEALRFN